MKRSSIFISVLALFVLASFAAYGDSSPLYCLPNTQYAEHWICFDGSGKQVNLNSITYQQFKSSPTQAQANANSSNGAEYQISLPHGSVGYVYPSLQVLTQKTSIYPKDPDYKKLKIPLTGTLGWDSQLAAQKSSSTNASSTAGSDDPGHDTDVTCDVISASSLILKSACQKDVNSVPAADCAQQLSSTKSFALDEPGCGSRAAAGL